MTLADVKHALRIDDDASDALLSRLLDAATAECCRWLGVKALPDPVPADVWQGILLMVHADYDYPERREQFKTSAIGIWKEHRAKGWAL